MARKSDVPGTRTTQPASTQGHVKSIRPRCVELARLLKKTGLFYYHGDWHASNLQPPLSQGARRELSA